MQEDAKRWNQECRWLKGTDTRQLWDRALTQQGRKRSCWQILRERQKVVAGQVMGRAAGKEVVPVGMLEKRWGQLSDEIKEKKGFIVAA